MIRILGVHGVRHYKNGDPPHHGNRRIARAWHAALATRLPDTRLDVQTAYYADLLRSDSQTDDDLHSPDPVEQALIDELLADWAAAWGVRTDGDQGRTTRPARVLLGRIAERSRTRPELVAGIARRVFPEVARYLGYADGRPRRRNVRARVAQALAAHRPDVVIAHSLGTVVAYETLHAHPDQHVPLLLTIGSPLALPGAIFERLEPGPVHGLGHRPPGVQRWVNLADAGDLIAIPPGELAKRFTGVEQPPDLAIGALAMHDATRYLASPRLAELIDTALIDTAQAHTVPSP